MGKNVYTILADTVGEKATITEADVWDAIGEAYGMDGDMSDGDLAEWL